MIRNALPSTTPCNDTVFVPLEISALTIQKNKHLVFMLKSLKSGKAYIATHFSKDAGRVGIRYLFAGTQFEVSDIYEELPWLETEWKDENGIFTFKEAPSDQAMEKFISRF
jgi:hypothetical protein